MHKSHYFRRLVEILHVGHALKSQIDFGSCRPFLCNWSLRCCPDDSKFTSVLRITTFPTLSVGTELSDSSVGFRVPKDQSSISSTSQVDPTISRRFVSLLVVRSQGPLLWGKKFVVFLLNISQLESRLV